DGRADLTTQVNTDTYGAVTAVTADSYVDVRPDNEINVGANAHVDAFGDLSFLVGMTAQVSPSAVVFTQDHYSVASHTADFSGAAIPISSVDSHAYVV